MQTGHIFWPSSIYIEMDPIGTIADTAAVGAVVGTAIALARKEQTWEYVEWGLVAGGLLGVCRALFEGLRF